MEEQRITTIVNEIEYWKEHKLLPAQQCDFLLALYTNGEEKTAEPEQDRQHARSSSNVVTIIQIVLLSTLLPFSFLVLYFTEFHLYLQLGILALFLSYAVWGFLYFKQRKSIYYHFSLMISLFILMFFTMRFSNLIFEQPTIVNLIIIMNFILWFFIGRYYKLQYLLITSILGLIFVIVYLFI